MHCSLESEAFLSSFALFTLSCCLCEEILYPTMLSQKMVAKDSAAKRKKDKIAIELKKIIGKHECGLRSADLAKLYSHLSSTICSILKKKEEIKKLDEAKGVTMITKQRPKLLEDVEKLLLVWINERQLKGDSMSKGITCAKAKAMYVDLARKTPDMLSEDEKAFKTSQRSFKKFKKRTGIHSVVRHWEAASYDTVAAEQFVPEFQELIASEGCIAQQVFNCDETGFS